MKRLLFLSIVFLSLLLSGCSITQDSVSTKKIEGSWRFKQADKEQWFNAYVPGNVHTDLLINKQINDPFFGTNEQQLQWIGKKDWIYETSFDATKEELSKQNVELIFKGLDTYCEVYLNKTLILNADNMFREWKVDVKKLLKPAGNLLQVKFKNVFDLNTPKWKNAPYRLMAFSNNDQADTMIAMYSRKAQFHYGWDWGPRFVTCGIWRPVILESWNSFKVEYVQIIQKNVNASRADLRAVFEINSLKEQDAELSIEVDEADVEISKSVKLKQGNNKFGLDFIIDNPILWWSNGLGDQHMYKVIASVKDEENNSDSKTIKTGVRSLEIIRDKDSSGTSLYVKLNGVPVFMKGANYIPQDNFQSRVSRKRYEHIIKSAADANMNMLRVWGGGIYEEDTFYDLCDKYGILIWQDFIFACAMYPADEDFLNSVKYEVIDNVKRIRNHPSLALYCGNNENEIAWNNWGWKPKYSEAEQKTEEENYNKLFNLTIPEALAQSDTTRYYHPTSPNAGYLNKNYGEGDIHYWGVWHGKEPFENYEKHIARFVSEYGFQSYPEMSTIEKFTNPEDRHLHSNVMLSHQRCMSDYRRDKEYGNRLIQTYLERQFKLPKNFESYVYVSQILQAEGVGLAIKAHRNNKPFCMGSLYWQINDCWPVASWSSIDYYGNWKALHYYTKKLYAEYLISCKLTDESLNISVVSDNLKNINAMLNVTALDFQGNKFFEQSYPVQINGNSSAEYLKLNRQEIINNHDETRLVILTQLKSQNKLLCEDIFYTKSIAELELEKADIKIEASKIIDGYELKLISDKLVKNLFLSSKIINGFFEENYFDLLPGRPATVKFITGEMAEDIIPKIKLLSVIDTY
ncbi:MAG: glycoside hydrolase family 2 protein [Bacteroidetes bacterium]|nr:glycoside hydrolase family 2 protein [Bacteroidota bacterium]